MCQMFYFRNFVGIILAFICFMFFKTVIANLCYLFIQ